MVVISISGKSGSGSTTIGKEVARKLNLDFFSLGEHFKEIGDKIVNSDPTTNITEYFGTKKGSDSKFHNNLDQYQVEKSKQGNIVMEGKLSIFILKDISDFKIWLKATPEVRASRYYKRESMENSIEILQKKDMLEKKNFMDIYDIDFESQENYADIVIDTSKKHVSQCVKEIIKVVSK